MFYDRIKQLCDVRGISPYKACTDIGLNRSAVAKWKNGGNPNGTTAAKLAEYFGVTTDYLINGNICNVETHINGVHVYSLAFTTADVIFQNFESEEYNIFRQTADLLVIVEKTSTATEAEIESVVALHFNSLPRVKEKTPALTPKDERDIAKDLELLLAQLDSGDDLMFDGDPMSDEAKESIRAAMKLGLEAAKVKNKERFTPKKYRKE